MKRLPLAFAVLLLLTPGADTPVVGMDLSPHRAVYALDLVDARQSSNIAAVSGRLVTEWKDNGCEGYVLTQRIFTLIEEMEGPQQSTDIRLSSYEAANGTLYDFILDNFYNGQRVESFRGQAKRASARSEGEVYLTQPENEKIALPPGTLFPSQLAVRLTRKVREGVAGSFERPSFDSSDYRKILRVFAFVGDAKKMPTLGDKIRGSEYLEGLTAAPVSLSYFDENRRDGLPEYEISFPLFENGVAGNMRIDYGDLILEARLIYVEPLPEAQCL